MKRSKARRFIVLGVVLALYIVLALVIPFPKTPAFWLAFAFTVAAICAQLLVMKIAFDKGGTARSKVYGFPVARVGFIYLVVQLTASFVIMALGFFFIVPIWIAIVLFALILGLSLIGFVTVDAARDKFESLEVGLKKDVHVMRGLQAKTASLPAKCADADTKASLQALADKFRYSDPVSSGALTSIENDLAALVTELDFAVSTGDNDSAKALCEKVSQTLDERNAMCRLNK